MAVEPGKLAIVEMAVSAVAAQGQFLAAQVEANNNSNATAGNLALNISFDLQGSVQPEASPLELTSTPEKYRTPILPSFSIGSGAPDELILYVKRIKLTKSDGKDPKESDGVSGPVSFKQNHPALFPEEYRTIIEGMVGKEYPSLDDLLSAAITAGVPEDAVKSSVGNNTGELPVGASPSGTDANASTVAVLFESEEGKPVKIANGAVDLSALASDAANGVAKFEIPEGEYDTLEILYRTKAEVKGCVKMLYECRRSPGETPQCEDTLPEDNIPGNKDLVGPVKSKMLTYCTQSAKSVFADDSQNSDFLNKEPELMDFALGIDDKGDWKNPNHSFSASYRLPEALVIKADAEVPRLTLLVDMNRMLRFYNRGRVDSGPNPAMSKTRAYFFTSIFPDNSYAFIGVPGKIYGFEMQANACRESSNDPAEQSSLQGAYDPATGKCNDGSTPAGRVPFWMTIITAGNGAPLYAITSPDDDNDLTITKGNVSAFKQCPGNEAPKKWVEAEAATSPQTVSIRYGLCDHAKQEMGPSGVYKHFPASLEDIPIMDSSIPLGDGNITGVKIETNARHPETGKETIYKGVVKVGRRL